MAEKFDTYFVLNKFHNGVEGEYATTCGVGEQQPDGWYWIIDGMDDGKGPFESKAAAERDVDNVPDEVCYATDYKSWRPATEADEGSERVTVTVTRKERNHYLIDCPSYYCSGGVLKLEITQYYKRSLATFGALLAADSIQEDLECEHNQAKR